MLKDEFIRQLKEIIATDLTSEDIDYNPVELKRITNIKELLYWWAEEIGFDHHDREDAIIVILTRVSVPEFSYQELQDAG